MKNFWQSKTNTVGTCIFIISIPMAIILKGSFEAWALLSGGIFWAITGRNIWKAVIEAKTINIPLQAGEAKANQPSEGAK